MLPAPKPVKRRWRVLVLLPIQFGWIVMIYGGLRVIELGSTAMGVLLLVTGIATAYLALRRLVATATDRGDTDPGELRGPEFDYIIWTAIGLPVLLMVALLVLLLTGDLK
jgi:divalent metal cation (Fe/Co/Zn/Cd) transporter